MQCSQRWKVMKYKVKLQVKSTNFRCFHFTYVQFMSNIIYFSSLHFRVSIDTFFFHDFLELDWKQKCF